MSGIIAGIVGGLVVTLFSNSSLGVSGPAAGLVAIVAPAILQLGFQNFLLAVVLAGVIQFVLGVMGGLSAEPQSLMMMLDTADRLFGAENYKWSVIGVGYPNEFHMATMGIIMGGHVRVGLEDNIFIRKRELATNPMLVEKVVRLANELEREIATPAEMREILALKGLEEVNF